MEGIDALVGWGLLMLAVEWANGGVLSVDTSWVWMLLPLLEGGGLLTPP